MQHPANRDDPALEDFQQAQEGMDAAGGIDVLGFLHRHRRPLAVVTVLVSLLTLGGVAASLALPPIERVCSLDITPTFPGAAEGKYPNKAPFTPQDLVANSVVEPVWRAQGLEKTVDLADLGRNLQVVAGGSELELLRADYLQRLSNAKLTTAERTAIESEFTAKLKSMKTASLTLSLAAAGKLTDEQMERLLLALPAEWARSNDAAGVSSYDFPLPLGSELRASGTRLSESLSAGSVTEHAERIKDFADSLQLAVGAMAKIPGSNGIKDASGATLVDLGAELSALRRNAVVPAYIDALRRARTNDPSVYQSIRATRLKLVEADLQVAKERVRAFQDAIEGYTEQPGVARRLEVDRADDSRRAGLQANVDASFIDRVIEQAIKGRDVEYRRTLTDRRLEAEMDVVRYTAKAEQERWIDSAVQEQQAAATGKGTEELLRVTEAVARCGDRVGEIFRTLSARNLGSTSAMYRMDTPPTVRSARPVSVRTVVSGGFAAWCALVALVVIRGAIADRRRAPGFDRLDARLMDEFRRESLAAIGADSPMRHQPRRLPDDARHPVG